MLDISQGGRWSGGRWHGYDDGSLQKRLDRGSRVPVSSVSVNDDSSDTLEPGPYTPRWRVPLPHEMGLGRMASHPTPCATPGDHSSAPLSMGTKGPSLERVSAAIGEVPGAHNLWAGVPVGAGGGGVASASRQHGMGTPGWRPLGRVGEKTSHRGALTTMMNWGSGAPSGAQSKPIGWGRQGKGKRVMKRWRIIQGGCTLSRPKFGEVELNRSAPRERKPITNTE